MEKKHLSALRRAHSSGWVLPDDQDNTMEALLKAEFVTSEGKLTDTGILASEKIVTRVEQLKKGVPFSERKICEPILPVDGDEYKWYTTKYTTHKVLTNKELWCVTPCPNYLEAVVEEMENPDKTIMNKKLQPVVQNLGRPLKFLTAVPTTWKVVDDLDVADLVIFEAEQEERTYTINAIYYDFIINKFDPDRTGKLSWLLSPQHPEWPLGVRTKRKAVSGFVAFIAPINL